MVLQQEDALYNNADQINRYICKPFLVRTKNTHDDYNKSGCIKLKDYSVMKLLHHQLIITKLIIVNGAYVNPNDARYNDLLAYKKLCDRNRKNRKKRARRKKDLPAIYLQIMKVTLGLIIYKYTKSTYRTRKYVIDTNVLTQLNMKQPLRNFSMNVNLI